MALELWAVLASNVGAVLGALILSVLGLVQGIMPGLLIRWRTQSRNDRKLAHEAHVAMLGAVTMLQTQAAQVEEMFPIIKQTQRDNQLLLSLMQVVSERGPRDIQMQLQGLSERAQAIERNIQMQLQALSERAQATELAVRALKENGHSRS